MRLPEDLRSYDALRAISERLAPQEATLVDGLLNTLLDSFPELRDDEQAKQRLGVSLRANVSTLIALMDESVDLNLVEPPAGAIQFAYYLAHQSFPISTLWRIYHVATAKFVDQCLRELFASAHDPTVVGEQTVAVSALIHHYVDKVCIRIGETYDQERERWIRGLDIKRVERVGDVLSGRTVDLPDTEHTLGYRLRNRDHLALVVWDADTQFSGQSLHLLQRSVAQCVEALGCTENPLFIAQSTTTAWVWLPVPKSARNEPAELLQRQREGLPPTVRIAIGELGTDVSGFVRTHRQAGLAQTVALSADHRQMTPYSAVGGLSFLCQDLDAARDWVEDTIGALAINDAATGRIRDTLRAYLECRGSLSAAAKQLGCHKNTVAYRVQRAEQAIGRPIMTRELDIAFALHACRWLPKVLLHG
ncbi:PucR family transcriptional regulator [Mycolicibacterium goodii]|uniref:PucR family transcriptional regulator n=1 Tax=Mycolicibacterium goodii TaxID=134601 RepID=UPI000C2651E4|nr:helix-turn-helix domain-containing protein [Mycolicibacterium goodii]PJK18218.1 hypothetical protein CSX11_32375 [Mycolicibacterium goodii]